jgi:hypothetical protein
MLEVLLLKGSSFNWLFADKNFYQVKEFNSKKELLEELANAGTQEEKAALVFLKRKLLLNMQIKSQEEQLPAIEYLKKKLELFLQSKKELICLQSNAVDCNINWLLQNQELKKVKNPDFKAFLVSGSSRKNWKKAEKFVAYPNVFVMDLKELRTKKDYKKFNLFLDEKPKKEAFLFYVFLAILFSLILILWSVLMLKKKL